MEKIPGGEKTSRVRRIAAGGIFASSSVVFLLIGGIFPFATFAAPVFAGLFLLPLAIEFGTRAACISHLAASLLAFFLAPDREMVLFFALFFGYYPFLRPALEKIGSRIFRVAIKFLLFNAVVSIIYFFLLPLLIGPEATKDLLDFSPMFSACLLLLANIVFFVYDVMVARMQLFYLNKLRSRIFR